MAAVHPSPGALRIPLAHNHNAVNSPFRSNLLNLSAKRSRTAAFDAREHLHAQPPVKKIHLEPIDDENTVPRTLARQSVAQQEAETKFFQRKSANATPTTLGRKLQAAAREKQTSHASVATRTQADAHKNAETADTYKQWIRHYRSAFPSYVFYFENVPEDVRVKVSRQVHSLGAREEKFFSKSVTHVITTRTIPSETASPHTRKTIDPSLLGTTVENDRGPSLTRAVQHLQSLRNRHAQQGRKSATNPDVLTRAREFEMKIWALEKLHRIIDTILHGDPDIKTSHVQLSRSHAAPNLVERPTKETDLQRLLRNEKITGPTGRDPSVLSHDRTQLCGYFIYVHDIDEQTRPTIMREYNKVDHQDGEWPRFRITSQGRCPFVEDTSKTSASAEDKRKSKATARQPEVVAAIPRTRSRAAELCKDDQDEASPEPSALNELSVNSRRSPRKQAGPVTTKQPLGPPSLPAKSTVSGSTAPLFGSTQVHMRGQPRIVNGEPVASGMQQSNVTSAIRSQAISSTAITAAAPGGRAANSKEIHALQRKVLERGVSASQPGMGGPQYNVVRAALNGDRALTVSQRGTKRKALGNVDEELDDSRPSKIRQMRSEPEAPPKELKPGYCENCRDKFEDFDEHVGSRKHRKFATTRENWKELDKLIAFMRR